LALSCLTNDTKAEPTEGLDAWIDYIAARCVA
jgi:hypothetical protein